MTRHHAQRGAAHDSARSSTAHDTHTPGRLTAAQPAAAPTSRPVEIAPDRHDHRRPNPLGHAVDVEMRTLLAHLQRNLALLETEDGRDTTLDAIDTRVEVAFRHVPEAQHEPFRTALRAALGEGAYAALGEAIGTRAATLLGVSAPATEDSVQLDGATGLGDGDVQRAASAGVSGSGAALPHLAQIQASFGHHDVSGINAHVGGRAAEAATTIGARAYATGNDVAFSTAPDLHLAAHEAAHVVQQRGGVQLSGGVGRAGDPYEQHADAVADVVVRGGNAAPLLDQMSAGGSAGVQRSIVQRDERVIVGHYTSSNVTMQLGQAGPTVVGRLEVHSHVPNTTGDRLHVYELSVERAWSNDGSDGFRGTARDARGTRAVTLIASAGNQVRVELGSRAYTMHRSSAATAMAPGPLAGASPLDRAAETAPLTSRQQADLTYLATVTRTHLRHFFEHSLMAPATPASRTADLAAIATAVSRLFATATPEQARQSDELATVTRARLQHELGDWNGMQWNLLDWLYMAMAQAPVESTALVDPIHTNLHIPIANARGATDGSVTHRYRISVVEAEGEVELGGGGAASGGLITVEALGPVPELSPNQRDPGTGLGHVLWTHSYVMGRGRLDLGASATARGALAHTAMAIVETPWPWGPQDFCGPFGGISASAGVEAHVGEDGMSNPVSSSLLQFYGTGVFPPLEASFGHDAFVGFSGSAGVGGSIEGGYMTDPFLDETARPPVAGAEHPRDTPVATGTVIQFGFDTGDYHLTDEGRHGLREILAWHRDLMTTSGTLVRIDAYASRLDSEASNLELAQRRRQEVIDAITHDFSIGSLSGEAYGERAAADAGVHDGDDSAEWRRVDIRINGTLVLQLYAPIAD